MRRREDGESFSHYFKIATMSSRPFRAYICLVITFTAAFLALSLRLLARRLTKLPLWYDDYLAILAFVGTTNPVTHNSETNYLHSYGRYHFLALTYGVRISKVYNSFNHSQPSSAPNRHGQEARGYPCRTGSRA